MTPGGHLRCVEKYKQNCESLCLGSITMCMPNFVKIRRVISKRRTEMWFIGSNFVDSWHFNKKPQFLTLRKNRKINPRLVSRHKKHVHANFCRNSRSGIQDITHAQLGSYIYSFSVGAKSYTTLTNYKKIPKLYVNVYTITKLSIQTHTG